MSRARITYTPRANATPESELDALAAIYKFVLECHARRKAADPTGDPNEAKEDKDIDLKWSIQQKR